MSESVPESKTCPDCGLEKSAADFRRNAQRPDGLGFYCRACVSRREKLAYRQRRERVGKPVRERAEVPEGHKWCPGCERARPLNEWGRNRRSRDGFNSYCKECWNARSARDYLRKTHGLTLADVGRLIADQGGLCLICVRAPAAHVDHDHATGERRGVLCFNCNVALGQFKDDPWILRRAIEYLGGGLLGLRLRVDGALEVAEVRPRAGGAAPAVWDDLDFTVLDARARGACDDPRETDVVAVRGHYAPPAGPPPDDVRSVGVAALPREPLGAPEWAFTSPD